MNRALEKHRVEPSLCFTNITSDALDIMRGGHDRPLPKARNSDQPFRFGALEDLGTAAPELEQGAH